MTGMPGNAFTPILKIFLIYHQVACRLRLAHLEGGKVSWFAHVDDSQLFLFYVNFIDLPMAVITFTMDVLHRGPRKCPFLILFEFPFALQTAEPVVPQNLPATQHRNAV